MITKFLKKYDIPLKTVTRKNNGGHVYGYRKYGERCVELKKEQEVIELVESFRRSGYSYQKIADLLNQHKVETKSKEGVWYSKVVRDVLLRNIQEQL